LKIPAIMPRLGATPGRTDWPGLAVGSHNDEILGGLLRLDADELERLRAAGVIG
jgi:crotonobetainyl-CoA:carnitine CoA-transferase CaiB-like acyl-CoA transferase